jgi:hypothetical protein
MQKYFSHCLQISFAGLLAFVSSSSLAAELAPGKAAVLVDLGVGQVGGWPEPMPWEAAWAMPPVEGELTEFRFDTDLGASGAAPGREVRGNSSGEIAANAVGAAIGNAIVAGAIASNRLKPLAKLDASIDAASAAAAIADGVAAAGSEKQMDRGSTLVSPAHSGDARVAFMAGDARYILAFDRLCSKEVNLSLDNRRLVFCTEATLYERAGTEAIPRASGKFIYVGAPLRDADPLEAWAKEAAALLRHHLAVAAKQLTAELLLRAGGRQRAEPTSTAGLVSEDRSHAVLRLKNGYDLVVPLSKEPPPSPVAPMFESVAAPIAPMGTGEPTVIVRAMNDSDAETSMRVFMFDAYSAPECKRASKVVSGKINPKRLASADSTALSIPSGAPLWFNVEFSGSSMGLVRACAATVSFTPEAGRRYRVEMAVDRQISACLGRVVELDSEGAPHESTFSRPPLVCGSKDQVNGARNWIRF